jgi:hypothetical protein
VIYNYSDDDDKVAFEAEEGSGLDNNLNKNNSTDLCNNKEETEENVFFCPVTIPLSLSSLLGGSDVMTTPMMMAMATARATAGLCTD